MLEAKGLSIYFENLPALNNVTLSCRPDQIIGVIGPSGAGKSTLMYALSGIIVDISQKQEMTGGLRVRVSGEISLNGRRLEHAPPAQRAKAGIVLCPERRRVFAESTVLENLKIGAHLAAREQAKNTLDYVFTLFPHLAELKTRLAGLLSGGEQQMLAIGRALMAQPKFLLLDEPLLGLSPMLQHRLADSLRDIQKQQGAGVIVAEQYARPVLPVMEYGYVMANGQVAAQGDPRVLLENPDINSAYLGAESGEDRPGG